MSPARRKALLVVAVLIALPLGILAIVRNAPVTPERAAALHVLAEPLPPVAGRDAMDALWLLGHDVPAAQRAGVAAQYRRYLDERAALLGVDRKKDADALTDPLAAFPAHADAKQAPGLCEPDAPCLAHVRADPAATAATLAANAAQLRAAVELVGFDGVRSGVQPSLYQQIPSYQRGRLLAYTALADRFARGETTQAIADTCRDLAGWRRLGADNDQLIGSMVGAAYVQQDLRLLAEMLAEHPAAEPLPEACTAALASTAPGELGICQVIRMEFRMASSPFGDGYATADGLLDRALVRSIDQEHLQSVVAPQYAHYCSAEVLALAAADTPASQVDAPAIHCGKLETVAHPTGCVLVSAFAGSSFDRYVDRRTDQAASIALMRTLVWLRAQLPDPAGWAALLPQRPASLGLRREPTVDVAKGTLGIEMFETQRGKTFELAARPGTETPAIGSAPR